MVYVSKLDDLRGKIFNFFKGRKLNVVIFLLFIISSIFISLKHEPWADEAQSWLIARDASFKELFTDILHSEGHPVLWYIVLKIFELFGLEYENMGIISIIFSSIAIVIFLEKSNFKWYFKILVPFSYFIFFQYTVIVRGYSLIFFLISILACIWKNRDKHYIAFTSVLILLINLEVHTFLLVVGICSYLFLELVYNRKSYSKEKIIRKIIVLAVTAIALVITTIYVFPRETNTFAAKNNYNYLMSDSFLTIFNVKYVVVKYIFSAVIVGMIVFACEENKDAIMHFSLFILPCAFFLYVKYCNLWHLGIIFIYFLFVVWINKLDKNKYIDMLLLVTLVVQFIFTISASIYDYNYKYSKAYDVAEIIKSLNYDEIKIFALDYDEVAINAYFEKNIFSNWNEKYGFFYWSKESNYYNHDYSEEYIKSENPEIIIYSRAIPKIQSEKFEEYNVYEFEAYTYAEMGIYEDKSIVMLIRKDVDIIHENERIE